MNIFSIYKYIQFINTIFLIIQLKYNIGYWNKKYIFLNTRTNTIIHTHTYNEHIFSIYKYIQFINTIFLLIQLKYNIGYWNKKYIFFK